MTLTYVLRLTKKSAVAYALCALVGGATASAQNTLSLEECLVRAQSQNPDLTAAGMAEKKALIQREASRAPNLPQVSTSLSTGKSKQVFGDDGSMRSGTTVTNNDYSAGVTVRQNIFAGFRDQYGMQKSDAEVGAARAALEQSRVELVYDLRNVFFTQLYLQDLVTLMQKTVSRRQENLRLVELRFQAGRENKGAFLKSRAVLGEASANLRKAQRDLLATQRQLALLIGERSAETLKVKGSFESPSSASEADPDFPAVAETTPGYQQAMAQAKAARIAIDVARAATYPSIDATGGVTRSGASWPPDNDQFSIGLTLSLPLYTGGSQSANIRTAVAESSRSDATLESTRRKIVVELVSAHTDLKNAADKLKVQGELAEADAVQAQIAQSQYDLGLISFQDWDAIENATIAAENGMLSARQQVSLAQAAWDRVLGKTL